MTGNTEVIKTLQSGLAAERHLNLQFRSDSHSLKKLGAKKTAKKFSHFADETHKFYDLLNKRLIFLDGDPSGTIAPVVEADSLTGVLQGALDMETQVCQDYERYIQVSMRSLDDGTRNLFEHLVKWKQRIINWLEIQLGIISKIGENDYLSEVM